MYLFKVSNRNTRNRFEICSKLITIRAYFRGKYDTHFCKREMTFYMKNTEDDTLLYLNLR